MRSRRSFYILAGITLAAVIAAAVSQRDDEPVTTDYGLHAPDLGDRADAVRVVEIRTATESLKLARTDEGWLAADRGDYPAAAERIRQLVLGMSRLRRIEKKTSDPARHARLELADVSEAGSRATRIDLIDSEGETLAALLVGKTQDFQADSRSRYFARNAGEDQAWLVEGVLPPVLDEMRNWLQQDLLAGIDDKDLRTVTVRHAGGGAFTIVRGNPEADFTLADLADGEQLDSQHAVDAVADTVRRLALKDFADDESARRAEPVATVAAETFNGVRVTAEIRQGEPDYLVQLDATHEPGAASQAENDSGPVDGEALAERLDQRWKDRWFVVSQYALDALLVERADFLAEAGLSDDD